MAKKILTIFFNYGVLKMVAVLSLHELSTVNGVSSFNNSQSYILFGVITRIHAIDSEQMRMVEFAQRRVNQHYGYILPGYQFKAAIETVPDRKRDGAGETLNLLGAFCRLIRRGVVAVLEIVDNESREKDGSSFLAHVANSIHLPYIIWRSGVSLTKTYPFTINIHPSRAAMNQAINDLVVNHLVWKDFAFIYGESANLPRAQNLLRAPTSQLRGIRIRRYSSDTVYNLLDEAHQKGWTNFILDLNQTSTLDFLQAALNKGMISKSYHYVLTSLDIVNGLRTAEDLLENYRYNSVNLSAFSFRFNNTSVASLLRKWRELRNDEVPNPSFKSALLHDAIWSLALAVRHYGVIPDFAASEGLFCNDPTTSITTAGANRAYGVSLRNYLNLLQFDRALTGPVEFRDGERYRFILDVNLMTADGMFAFGNWSTMNGLRISASSLPYKVLYKKAGPGVKTSKILRNDIIRVAAIIQKPFVMEKSDSDSRVGRDRYEGFCISMMELIANRSKFDWDIHVLKNSTYGALVTDPETGERRWTGLMAELIEGRAHLALGAFSISYLREKAIDFTKPFMSLGISILFKKPEGEKPGLFSFLNPLAPEIWLYLVVAYLIVTLCIYVMARFTPYEWHNPHPCDSCSDEETPYLQTAFTLANSFWFTVGTLTQQGSDINPRALSTRLVGGVWWFFTLIIISSYTANLAAFLTVERHVAAIESVEDLARQKTIKYGVLDGGSTMEFFQNSTLETYKTMWSYMSENRKSVMVESTHDGVARVKKENYAFLMESAMIEYHISQDRDCELYRVGGLIDSKGYGIGVAPGWGKLRDELTLHILKLQRDQILQTLKNKWWRDGSVCQPDSHRSGQDVNEPRSLDLYGVGGIFMTLGLGLVLAVFIACVEFTWNSRQRQRNLSYSSRLRPTLCQAMGRELRFACDCYGSSRKKLSHSDFHSSDLTRRTSSSRSACLIRGVEFRRYGSRIAEHSPIIEYKTICTETVT